MQFGGVGEKDNEWNVCEYLVGLYGCELINSSNWFDTEPVSFAIKEAHVVVVH